MSLPHVRFSPRNIGLLIAVCAVLIAWTSYQEYVLAEPTLEDTMRIEFWSAQIEELGSTNAYEAMVRAVSSMPTVEQHIVAHTFGAALYEREGTHGIEVCDARPTYGCFHEVTKRYIDEHGTSELKSLADMCDRALPETAFLCKHGIGHGLMLLNGRTIDGLRTSLSECDTVMAATEWEGCHSGAFMEYDFDMGEPGSLEISRPLEDGAYFSPCDSVAEPYYTQCIRRRPYWWMVVLPKQSLEDKLASMLVLCRKLEQDEAAVQACFTGVGHQAAFLSGGNRSLAERYCTARADDIAATRTCAQASLRALEVLAP